MAGYIGGGVAVALIDAAGGAGLFKGENGDTGDTTNGLGDIFRVHENAIDTDITIDANTNAMAAGPLTVNSTITVNGSMTVV